MPAHPGVYERFRDDDGYLQRECCNGVHASLMVPAVAVAVAL